MKHQLDRRTFIQSLLATGGYMALPAGAFASTQPSRRTISPNQKVNLACVGIGNRGVDDVNGFAATNEVNIVALCDTEMEGPRTLGIMNKYPDVPKFRDFREMFDKMGKDIDAVSIAIPDHSHFAVAILAMSLGKHVYVEKPLAHSFRQIDLLMAAEKKYKVACQMGNQGHSEGNYFQFKAWTEAGIIKNVHKITAFMNSSRRWHGMNVKGFETAEFMPEFLDWNVWLTTATEHPYSRVYLNGDWRSWFDYGDGALGDWGAHIFDTAHEFLQLGLPTSITPTLEGHNPFIFPQASTLAFHFPKRGDMPACEMTWYDGQQNLPPLPEGFVRKDPSKPLLPGKVIYGEGLTFQGSTHGATLSIIPAEAAKDIKLPEVPKSPSNHYLNFVRACRGEEVCRSNFAVAGPLSQVMNLGVIAQRVNAKLEFDPKRKQITNHKVANELLNGVPPRKGWEQYYKL